MYTVYAQIGTHILFMSTKENHVYEWITEQFHIIHPDGLNNPVPNMYVRVESGYGSHVQDIKVHVSKEGQRVTYQRDDFFIETDANYERVQISVHDDLALNHALMTVYSAYIVHRRWGLMIHSSCVRQGDAAYLFAGQSGAGKSTVAMLSHPRTILSDEATLVRLETGEALVYDSPFRSDSAPTFDPNPVPLRGIHLLTQSLLIERKPMRPSELVFRFMDKIFYWAVDPAETASLIQMCGQLAELVPAYDLYFQKNDLFWERIS